MKDFIKEIYKGAVVGLSAFAIAYGTSAAISNYIMEDGVVSSVVEVVVNDDQGKELGHGSGAYIREGLVLTAAHVVKGNTNFTIVLDNGRTFVGTVEKVDEKLDVAVIKTANSFTKIITMKCDTYLNWGEPITTYGYPMNLGRTSTQGQVVSQYPKAWGHWKNVYIVDATMGPGMSGGPSVNYSGELVGVNVGLALIPLGFSSSVSGFNLMVPSKDVCDWLNN